MNIRDIAQQFASSIGLSSWAARRVRCGRIIMLHSVEPSQADVFEQQLRYLANNYDLVPLSTFVQRAQKGLRHEVVLTFDDGLRNNFLIVYPILQKLRLPATFFVCPALIDRGAWLWNHEARARVRSMESEARRLLAVAVGAPNAETEPIIEWMKTLATSEREKVERAIRAATPAFKKTSEQSMQFDPMSWSELASLDRELISVGSHTSSHPILSTLDAIELEREIANSRTQLESRLGRQVPHFCYPNGSHNPGVVDCVRSYYDAAVTTEPAFVADGSDLHLLPRIPWAPSIPLLAWRLWRPQA